jgi:hypothetical protein
MNEPKLWERWVIFVAAMGIVVALAYTGSQFLGLYKLGNAGYSNQR